MKLKKWLKELFKSKATKEREAREARLALEAKIQADFERLQAAKKRHPAGKAKPPVPVVKKATKKK